MTTSTGSIVSGTLNTPVPKFMANTIEVTEGVTAIPSCNGQDFWIIAHGAFGSFNNRLLAYLVTPLGVSEPVLSNSFAVTTLYGYVTTPDASRDGQLYAASSWTNGHIYVYNFDNGTGAFTLHTDISSPSLIGQNVGISFSPNGDYLYTMTNVDEILQVDISTPGSPSVYTLSFDSYVDLSKEAFQLGPDNRLYVGKFGQSELGVINFPDAAGAGMGFDLDGVDLGPGQICRAGLPNPMDARLNTYTAPSFTITYIDCETVHVEVDECWSGYRARWNFGDGSALVSGLAANHTYAADGTYTITLQLGINGSFLPDITQTVTVYPSGTVTISGPTYICLTSTNTGTYSVSVPGSPTYAWSVSSNGIISGSSTGSSINVNWFGLASTETVNVTVTLPYCTLTGTLTVILDRPEYSVGVSPAPVCAGTPSWVHVTPGPGTGPYTYLWNSGSTAQSFYDAPLTTRTYTVTVTTASGCSQSGPITLIVYPVPTISITSSPSGSVCSGTLVNLTTSSTCPFGTCTYLWSTAETTSGISVSPTSTTTYTVTITDGHSCSASASQTITVNPNPTIDITPDNPSICVGSSVALSTSASCSGTCSYLWSTGATTTGITVSPTSTTTYSVTITDGNGCTATTSETVTVNPNPTVTLGSDELDNMICTGDNVVITAHPSCSTCTYTYHWSPGGATTSSITVSPLLYTTYTVTVTDVNGCTGSGSLLIAVVPPPTVTIHSSEPDNTICSGEPIVFTTGSSCPIGPCTYLWSTGATTAGITDYPTVSTNYTVTITDVSGCTGINAYHLIVHESPTISVACEDDDCTICMGGSITLNTSSTCSNGPCTYSWSTGATTADITDFPTAYTTYSVVITDANSCSGTATIDVDVDDECEMQNYCKYVDNSLTGDNGRHVIATPDGGFVVVGEYMESSKDKDMYFVKYDASGAYTTDVLWGDYMNNEEEEETTEDVARGITPVDDGYLVIGTVRENSNYDFAITKLNLSYVPQWSRRCKRQPTVGEPNNHEYGIKIVVLEPSPGDLHYYAIGHTNSFNGYDYDVFVMEFDPTNGNEIATNTFGNAGTDEKVNDAIADNTKSYILLVGERMNSTTGRNIISYRIDASLNMVGEVELFSSKSETGTSIAQNPDDNTYVYLCGYSSGSSYPNSDLYIAKVRVTSYVMVSDILYSQGNNVSEFMWSMIPVKKGLVLAGHNSRRNGITLHVDWDMKAQRYYESTPTEREAYNSIAWLESHDFAITGNYYPAVNNGEVLFVVADDDLSSCCNELINISEKGHLQGIDDGEQFDEGNMSDIDWGLFTNDYAEEHICPSHHRGNEVAHGDASLLVVPNPNNGLFKIDLNSEEETMKSVSVYDFSGRLILTFDPAEGSAMVDINLDNVHSGLYTVVVNGSGQSQWRTTVSVIR